MPHPAAGWHWYSEWHTNLNTDPLFTRLVTTLGSSSTLIRSLVDAGVDAHLTLVGEIYGIVISTPGEADLRGYLSEPDDPYLPFFAADRVAVHLDKPTIEFLATSGTTFETHIDAALDTEWLQEHS